MRAGLDEGRLVSAYLSHIIDVELLAPLDDQLIVNLGLALWGHCVEWHLNHARGWARGLPG